MGFVRRWGRAAFLSTNSYFVSSPGGKGFSKLRFILSEKNDLKLVNSPTIPPTELISQADRFDDLPFMEYNTVFQEKREDYRMTVLRTLWSGKSLEDHLNSNRFTRNSYSDVILHKGL